MLPWSVPIFPILMLYYPTPVTQPQERIHSYLITFVYICEINLYPFAYSIKISFYEFEMKFWCRGEKTDMTVMLSTVALTSFYLVCHLYLHTPYLEKDQEDEPGTELEQLPKRRGQVSHLTTSNNINVSSVVSL